MSEENSPYATPQAQQPLTQQPVRSSVPKVMGILHIVFASFGILGSLSAFFTASIFKNIPLTGNQDADVFVSAMEKMLTYTYIDAGVKIILGVLLLISGIKLLKYQASGLKLSNMWAYSRIIWAVIFAVISYSATIEFQQAMVANSPGAASIMKTAGTFGLIIGILILCIYPVVSLILLNRPNVKKDLN